MVIIRCGLLEKALSFFVLVIEKDFFMLFCFNTFNFSDLKHSGDDGKGKRNRIQTGLNKIPNSPASLWYVQSRAEVGCSTTWARELNSSYPSDIAVAQTGLFGPKRWCRSE